MSFGSCPKCQPQQEAPAVKPVPNQKKQNDDKNQKEKTLGEIMKGKPKSEKLEPNETIYYACPHQAKMTEPNCKICLNEAEEELKLSSQNSTSNNSENIIGNSVSNVHI